MLYFFLKFFQEKIRDENITPEELQSNPIYYTRTEGLFRICFPNDRPKGKGKRFFVIIPNDLMVMCIPLIESLSI